MPARKARPYAKRSASEDTRRTAAIWALLLKWDTDSPVNFKPDGHTVHDFDRRFQMEDDGWLLPDDRTFRWAMLDDDVQMKFF